MKKKKNIIVLKKKKILLVHPRGFQDLKNLHNRAEVEKGIGNSRKDTKYIIEGIGGTILL